MVGHNGSEPVVEINDVVKSFSAGRTEIAVLKGVSLAVHEGEFVSIVGPSGSGKSTLLNMITGIDRPSDGEIVVLGRQVHEMDQDSLARWRGENVGVIFQFFQMLPALTLLKNVILPMDLAKMYEPKERRERAMLLLDRVGLADQAHKLPGMVSGGQQQRAAIARALANDPALLVADEPTGNLDSTSAQMMFDLFHQLVEGGKTMIVVTHDRNLVKQVPRRIEVRDGAINCDERGQVDQGSKLHMPPTCPGRFFQAVVYEHSSS
jgi:putative ABC transport system ATP-binding protein